MTLLSDLLVPITLGELAATDMKGSVIAAQIAARSRVTLSLYQFSAEPSSKFEHLEYGTATVIPIGQTHLAHSSRWTVLYTRRRAHNPVSD